MTNIFYTIFPMLFSLTLSQTIFSKIDEKYNITDKINSKLSIKQEKKASFCSFITLIIVTILGLFRILLFQIPTVTFFILIGILGGLGIGITNKIRTK